jgi:hypothetical protein
MQLSLTTHGRVSLESPLDIPQQQLNPLNAAGSKQIKVKDALDIASNKAKTRRKEIDHEIMREAFECAINMGKNIQSLENQKTLLEKESNILRNQIRVKKGLYLFGSDYRKGPYSPEIMANKIYGPSYVSREYALAY